MTIRDKIPFVIMMIMALTMAFILISAAIENVGGENPDIPEQTDKYLNLTVTGKRLDYTDGFNLETGNQYYINTREYGEIKVDMEAYEQIFINDTINVQIAYGHYYVKEINGKKI